MATTMKDVAERAGVSIATVSFVVNNTKNVTPETRERIEVAMRDLGFRRNIVARALASRRTRIIALVFPALGQSLKFSGTSFITSAAQAASEADHNLVVWQDHHDARQLSQLVGQGLVDGVVLMEVQLDDPRVEVLKALDLPFALIGRTRDTTGLHYVDIDFDQTVRAALEHLRDLGHCEVVLLASTREDEGFKEYGPSVRTEAAFQRIAVELGMRPMVQPCEQTVFAGRAAAIEIARVAPDATAVLVSDDGVAAGLVAGLHRRGLRIPDDLSVVSLLTSLEYASMCDPTLTLITSPGEELGRLGVEALLRELHGDPPTAPVLRAGVLQIGGSTGPARTH